MSRLLNRGFLTLRNPAPAPMAYITDTMQNAQMLQELLWDTYRGMQTEIPLTPTFNESLLVFIGKEPEEFTARGLLALADRHRTISFGNTDAKHFAAACSARLADSADKFVCAEQQGLFKGRQMLRNLFNLEVWAKCLAVVAVCLSLFVPT